MEWFDCLLISNCHLCSLIKTMKTGNIEIVDVYLFRMFREHNLMLHTYVHTKIIEFVLVPVNTLLAYSNKSLVHVLTPLRP